LPALVLAVKIAVDRRCCSGVTPQSQANELAAMEMYRSIIRYCFAKEAGT